MGSIKLGFVIDMKSYQLFTMEITKDLSNMALSDYIFWSMIGVNNWSLVVLGYRDQLEIKFI